MTAGDDAELVERVRGGDTTAFAPLFERWHDRVFNVARGVLRNNDMAAEVTQEAFLTAWQRIGQLDDVGAFGGWLLRITRNKALNTLQRERRSTPFEDDIVTAMHDRGVPDPAGAARPPGTAEEAESHDRQELVWAAAAALGERDASVLDLHLRHGLSAAELADDLGVEPNNAHQMLFRLRKRLEDAVGSFLLWRYGAPTCPELRAVTGRTFDARQASSIRRHARSCERCSDERRRQTRPAALFAAAPLMIVPVSLRARSAAGLEAAGVPMPTELTGALAEHAGDDGGRGSGDRQRSPGDDGGRGDDGGGAARVGRWAPAVLAVVIMLVVSIAVLVAGDRADAPGGLPPGTGDASAASDDVPVTTAGETTVTSPSTTGEPTPAVTAVAPQASGLAGIADDPVPATTQQAGVVTPPPVPRTTAAPRGAGAPGTDAGPPSPTGATTAATQAGPAIVRYDLGAGRHQCSDPLIAYVARWATERVTAASLSWSGGSAPVAPEGTHELCLHSAAPVTLTATGSDGGSVSATATAPDIIPTGE